MSLPNLKRTVLRKAQTVKYKMISQEIINYEAVNVESAPIDLKATIQAVEKDQIKKDKVDYNLEYISIHTIMELKISDVITYKEKDFRIFWTKNLSEYGFFHAQGEEIK